MCSRLLNVDYERIGEITASLCCLMPEEGFEFYPFKVNIFYDEIFVWMLICDVTLQYDMLLVWDVTCDCRGTISNILFI